ncbi:hypothetical protein NIES593_03635 [Hydrococcus rivularis NIES-593]|uniref:Uncharacterized protein n=1 Tax=Hydrococcus rivularis NIES-593 TaxID=1921803 RepID=A0A1U7HRF1_9CYAN|nr:hypothetical protein [Hydrococcus rivularis]OKH26173.1 hypothetical protein NIES593_03635 [Hydrococcus rivularis NIES-593]
MIKEMAWLPMQENKEEMALHLRTTPNRPWKPYTSFPEYAVPDHPIPGGSKGYATFQKLRLQGWNLLSTRQASRLNYYA